jgi:hypothetical protein
MPHPEQALRAASLHRRWGKPVVVCDTTGGATGGHAPQDSYVKLYRAQIPNLRAVYLAPTIKQDVVSHLALAIQQKHVSVPAKAEELQTQLAEYEFSYSGGLYRFHGPQGHRDDLVVAFALAEWGRHAGWGAEIPGALSLAGL